MTETLGRIAENISSTYFCNQAMVMIALFVVGFLFVCCFMCMSENIKENCFEKYIVLMSFPVGVCLFSLCGVTLLILGIKYSALSVLSFVLLVIILSMAICRPFRLIKTLLFENKKRTILVLLIVVATVLVSVSGIISIGYSNDSMYYYSAYPHEIVVNGFIHNKFDIFLTDAGQATAVLNTLPFLFGFNETFGIHTFFNINFVCFFFLATYEEAGLRFDRKKQLLIASLTTLLLVTSMPYIFVSKWVIANMYFMETMFMILHLNHRFVGDDKALIVRVLMITTLAFVRIEGALYVGFIILTYLTQEHTKKKEVAFMGVPALVLQALYFYRIFTTMDVLAVYKFMTKQKAVLAVVFMVIVIGYGIIFASDSAIVILKNKYKTYKARVTETALIGGLLLVNAMLFIYDMQHYLLNIKSMILNVTGQSGWGFFAAVVISFIILAPKSKLKDGYYDIFCVGFILISIAACFARGDSLRADLYDSGNRVMLQMVPFVVYAISYRYINLIEG